MIFKRNKKYGFIEKRSFRRVDFIQPTFFKLINDNIKSSTEECYISNISYGGISFEIKTPALKRGNEVLLLYKVNNTVRRDKMVVCYVEKVFNNYRCGCKFIQFDKIRDSLISKAILK